MAAAPNEIDLVMVADLPPVVAASAADGLFRGRITLVNRSLARISGATAASPDVYVVREGHIAALPPPKVASARLLDLAPGDPAVYDSAGSLVGCSDGEPLAPGRYEVYARLEVGSLAVTGGPWPLEVT
jgi:hypothetical protein